MTYRWAVMLAFAMLSSTGLPAAIRAQSARPTIRASDETDADSPPASSPANRFARTADSAQMDLSQPSSRPPKRSVLEPITPRWLEDDAPQPPQAATSPQALNPEFLPATGPGPEAMPEELAPPGADGQMSDTDQFLPGSGRHLFQRIPRIGPIRQPMMRDSWQFRPFNISVFEGALLATAPVVPEFRNGAGFFTGFRVGWDFATHFGAEARFGFSKVFLDDVTRSASTGYEKLFYFDTNLLYYPLGDTRWRPFFSIGGGLADANITGNFGTLHPTAFNLPFGGGIKYRYGSRVAFRADIRDNLTFSGSGGLRTLNNIELLGGIEFHFGGGERRSYWPWNPSRHWW